VPDSLFESELFGYERGAFTGAHASKDGKLKLADGGSIFLDEIGDLSLYTQAKMLRVLENKEIERLGATKTVPLDVRVIAATNRDLEQLVANGQFRADLFFRLDVLRIHLPPLRNRKEDIPLLLEYYIRKLNSRLSCEVQGFTEETLEYLLQYDWPGNIRELKNMLECVFASVPGRWIALTDLPARFRVKLKPIEHRTLDDREKIISALLATDWNKSRAAQKLQWSRMTLYRKMAKFGVEQTHVKCRPQVEETSEKGS
jgi:transcriptional regulator with PAS, ATPase and Fis domain